MPSNNHVAQLVSNVIDNLITVRDVEIVTQRATNDCSVKVLDYRLVSYSSDRLGYLGSHQLLNIEVQRSDVNYSENISLFVKSVPYDCKEQSELMNNEGIFLKESNIFDKVIPNLTKNYTDEKWSPTCYLAKKDVLIMEDLRSQGYKLLGNFFDEPAPLKSTLTALARFHACSILAEARLNENAKFPKTLAEQYPDCCKETTFTRASKLSHWVSAGINVAATVAERLGHSAQKIRKSLNQIYDVVKPSKIHRNVFCHGDLWTNNIMFNTSESSYKCVLLDFQIARYAPLALDVVQFWHLNTTPEFRSKHEQEYIKFYHNELAETVRKSDLTKKVEVPTLKEIFDGLNDLRLFGLAIPCLYLPIALLDLKIATDCTRNSEEYEKFIFEDRTKVVLAYMEKDNFYKSKIEDAVTEMAKFSELLYI